MTSTTNTQAVDSPIADLSATKWRALCKRFNVDPHKAPKIIGEGSEAIAFRFGSRLAIKITMSDKDARMARKMMRKPNALCARVFAVGRAKTYKYYIVQEYVKNKRSRLADSFIRKSPQLFRSLSDLSRKERILFGELMSKLTKQGWDVTHLHDFHDGNVFVHKGKIKIVDLGCFGTPGPARLW